LNHDTKEKIIREANVQNVLNKDGIAEVIIGRENQCHYPYEQYLATMGDPPWAMRIVYNETMSGVLICQRPGTGSRTHYHKDHDEWWVILKGEVKWWIEDAGVIHAQRGDIVFVPRGKRHKIRTEGEESSIRLAISPPDVPHFHPEVDPAPDDF